jgi:hypothetical protein
MLQVSERCHPVFRRYGDLCEVRADGTPATTAGPAANTGGADPLRAPLSLSRRREQQPADQFGAPAKATLSLAGAAEAWLASICFSIGSSATRSVTKGGPIRITEAGPPLAYEQSARAVGGATLSLMRGKDSCDRDVPREYGEFWFGVIYAHPECLR